MTAPESGARAPLLTIGETASLLRVSERTIRRWIGAGNLPAHQFGRSWRIARVDLEDHLRRHRRGHDRSVL